jgi:hypothetical protein
MKFQIPAMLASGGGAIVNMASIAGLNGTANLAEAAADVPAGPGHGRAHAALTTKAT